MSDKIDLKITKVTQDKEEHFMIKETLHQDDVTLLCVYEPNQGAPKCIKRLLTELKEETEKNHSHSW